MRPAPRPDVHRASPLARALAYRNRNVVDRFLAEYPIGEAAAQDVFRETKRWLWFVAHTPTAQPFAITTPMLVVDEMWHAFILFTADYDAYCQRHFGRFIHHAPTTHAEAARFRNRLRASAARLAGEIATRREAQYRAVLEHLGERTLRKWYVDYAARYTPEKLEQLRTRARRERRA